MGCNCNKHSNYAKPFNYNKRIKSDLLNKFIIDDKNRKLLVQESIYDAYNDIIGYVTKNETGNIIRIFAKNIVEIIK